MNINLYFCYGYVLSETLILTHPHLDVVSGGLWQLLVEPWRVVEGATIPIPQRIGSTRVAEIILHHKLWNCTLAGTD